MLRQTRVVVLGKEKGVNVEICVFAGEEQGLLGSAFYARQLKENGTDVLLMSEYSLGCGNKVG